jgi:hypothetical protein
MRSAVRYLVTLTVLALVPVSSARGQQPAPVTADSAAHPAAPWGRLYYGSYDAAAAAAGLRPLRTTVLPPGHHEIRIWTQLEIAVPKYLYRIVEAGGRTTGELIFYWSAPPPDAASQERAGGTIDDVMRRKLAGRCDRFATRAGMTVCRARFTQMPDWGGLLRRMEAHGLWTIPDPSQLPSDGVMVFDGWTIGVEVRDGASYHAYQYNNPESHPKWPATKAVLAIARELPAVDSLIVDR